MSWMENRNMGYGWKFVLLMAFVCFLTVSGKAQTIVKGKITDALSGDPIPYANVVFKGTTIGTTTDFDGNFVLKGLVQVDSIHVSYIGYIARSRAIVPGKEQVINIQLQEQVTNLQEVVVNAGENPAFEIIRKVNKNRSVNDKRKLSAYEYDTYTKIEIDVDNISDKFRERKVVRKIAQVLDSVERIAGEDGKPILPIFISESISKFYYRKDPQLRYENILKSKINGIGVDDGTLVTQVIGSSFQEYNFYQSWLNILGKDFISPIAEGWRLYYDYDLSDSLYVGNDYCYRIDFFPRSPQELAFTGTIWVTKEDFALKQIDASIGKQANLNFIEKIRIQQELQRVDSGAWIPVKNRILFDVSEITNNSAGMLAKFYTSNQNIVVNKPYEVSYYERPIVMAEDARLNESEAAWDTLRHEPLSDTEKNVYKMIDTLQNLPVIRTYTDIAKIAVNGYFDAGRVYLGPYSSLVGINNIEGFRIQGGFKTSMDFSSKWILRGQLGYGFKDERFKYSASVTKILSRDRWTTVSFRMRKDLMRIGIDDEVLADNYLFLAAQRWGTFRRGYYFDESRLNIQRELFRGFTQRLAVRYQTFNPTFAFGYVNENGITSTSFQTAEVILESRYARDELFVQDDNDRISLGTIKSPVITFRYTHGFSGIGGSDFDYSKIKLSLVKRLKWGPLGAGNLTFTGEYVFGSLPYPLLTPHLGNQTPIYTSVTFNLMNYGEFVSDRYAMIQYQHHFEGFLLNRIPLIRKLKWRLVGSANVLYGGMSENNRKLIPQSTEYLAVGRINPGTPYVELGYGIENIFKFFRVDFVHRLSYPGTDVRRFAVLGSFQFTL